MDRTVIDTWKAEEKDISEKLHQKLSALTLLHPPSDDFKKCFTDDMFVKPNQKGFFQVMHYLFNIHDPAEFKKRFYWPLLDKKTEANFRSSTVQYLNHLNEKHNLQWQSVKSYLVVMPGGMKFITFISGFVDFIVRELIKQREKILNIEPNGSGKVDDLNLRKLELQNKCVKNNSARYIQELEMLMVKLKNINSNLIKKLDEISVSIKMPLYEMLQPAFLESFNADNNRYFKQNFVTKSDEIIAFEDKLKILKINVDTFQNQDSDNTEFNKNEIRQSMLTIQSMYPDLDLPPVDKDIPIDNLVTIFNKVFPHIEMSLNSISRKSAESVSFEENELVKLKSELIQVESNVTKFMATINSIKTATPLREHPNFKSLLETKFVHTPTIKIDFTKVSNCPRLPFLDDYAVDRSICESASFVAQPVPTKAFKRNDSIQVPQSHKKSKIIDPMALLRSLSKDTNVSRSRNNSRNLSQLASKWKERESLFGIDDAADEGKPKPPAIFVSVTEPRKNSDPAILKSLGVQKLQDDSFNLHNLSTSPSGRLDSLVSYDQKELARLGFNDRALDSPVYKHCGNDSFDAMKLTSPISSRNKSQNRDRQAPVNDENNLNISNLCFQFANNNISDGDTLFNISDSVLKDVTM